MMNTNFVLIQVFLICCYVYMKKAEDLVKPVTKDNNEVQHITTDNIEDEPDNNDVELDTTSKYGLEVGIKIIKRQTKTRRGSETKQITSIEDILMENCGISKDLGERIVNGKDAAEGTYPWIVAILKFGDAWCGGTIINEWWIISASHCFMGLQDTYAYVARVGTVNRNIGPTYKIKKLIMHERFHLDNMFNSDIALLKVDRPIKMGNEVNGICLPINKFEEPMTKSLIVTGWGATEFQNKNLPVKLQEITLDRISDGQCAKKYQLKQNVIYKSQLCTWTLNKDACQGDSGGPAIELQFGRAFLVGIVSYGTKCADDFPGVYTQVSYFLDWIVENIRNTDNSH